eukprot:5349508-Pleurochrysis_carterae.AAC.1
MELGAQLNTLAQVSKRIKTDAENARKLEATRAATHADMVAELKGELASAASQAESRRHDMEEEHMKAMDCANIRVRKLLEKVNAETTS